MSAVLKPIVGSSPGINFKFCRGDMHWVHVNGFTKKSQNKDGLQDWCRQCMKAYRGKRVAAKASA